MNYKPFNELADIALKYMNPANDWRFIHADTYMFYNISNQSTYNNSIPAWKHYQQVLFKEIRPVSYTHLRAHETDSYLECRDQL